MDVTIMPRRGSATITMLDQLRKNLPQFEFCPGDKFSWSPQNQRITFCPDQLETDGRWALLHESGHATLGHRNYQTDYELLRMEVEAWAKAQEIALDLGMTINEEHIQECLDSYRDWLYKRSNCPACGTRSIQLDTTNSYSCFNCHACWQVTPSRFCRSYRTLKQNRRLILS